MLDTAISCIAIKWIFVSSPKMTLFELIGHPPQIADKNIGVLGALPLGERVAEDRNAGCSVGETFPTYSNS